MKLLYALRIKKLSQFSPVGEFFVWAFILRFQLRPILRLKRKNHTVKTLVASLVGIGEGVLISACYSATTPPPPGECRSQQTQNLTYIFSLFCPYDIICLRKELGACQQKFSLCDVQDIFRKKKQQQLTILIRRLIVKRLVCVGLNERSTEEHRVLLNRFVDPAWGWVQRKEDNSPVHT